MCTYICICVCIYVCERERAKARRAVGKEGVVECVKCLWLFVGRSVRN